MKKFYLLSLIGVMAITSLFAQVPGVVTYQAVLRDPAQALIVNQNIGVKISLVQGSSSGTEVYVETHAVATNANGLFTLPLGSGTVVSGDINAIDWSAGPYFVKTDVDPTGGSSYSISGVSALNAVPYAIYAEEAESIAGGEQDPAFTGSAASGITSGDIDSWNNKLTTETDPVFGASAAGSITNADISNWNNKLSTETDPSFNSSAASGITSSNITTWNNKLDAETDPSFSSSVAAGITSLDTARWNSNNGTGGAESDPIFNASVAKGITADDTAYWNNLDDSWDSNESSVFTTKKVGIGTDLPTDALDVNTDKGVAISGTSNMSNTDPNSYNNGLYGHAEGSTKLNIGVDGTAIGGAGDNTGVGGYAFGSTNMTNTGVYGYSNSSTTKNVGVHGFTDGNAAINYGGYLESIGAGTDNYGLFGTASGATNFNIGVRGVTTGNGAFNRGVTAAANGTTDGENIGIISFASSSSTKNIGGSFLVNATGADAAQNTALQGIMSGANVLSVAVKGQNFSTGSNNFSGVFESNGVGSGKNVGANGYAAGGAENVGIEGKAEGEGDVTNVGVFGFTINGTGTSIGVEGSSLAAGQWNHGGSFKATGIGAGVLVNIGAKGYASGSALENWGGYFEANGEAGDANWQLGLKSVAKGPNQANHVGVWAVGGENTESHSAYNGNFGVIGVSTFNATNRQNHVGLYGYASNNPSSNVGVDGTAASSVGDNTGVGGFAYGTTTGVNKALHGYAEKKGTANYAVFGEIANSGTSIINYSGYFKGAPVAVEDDNVYVKDFNKGVVLTSPNGQCWQVKVDDSGALTTTSVACPN